MSKPNFVRIASGQFLIEYIDSVSALELDMATLDYEDWTVGMLEEKILDLAKLLEDMYNTGVQAGVREATKRGLCDGS